MVVLVLEEGWLNVKLLWTAGIQPQCTTARGMLFFLHFFLFVSLCATHMRSQDTEMGKSSSSYYPWPIKVLINKYFHTEYLDKKSNT